MVTYLTPCQWRPIISSTDLFSPLQKYSLILSHLNLKSTPKHGNNIPLPPATVVRVVGNFHEFPWVWRLSVQLENICAGHTPKTSIFQHLRVKADQLTWGEGYGRVIDPSEGQGHMPYMENHVFLKVKLGHLTTLSQFLLLFHFDLELGGVTPNLCWMAWQIYFYKIYSKSKKENVWNPAEKNTVSYGHR